MQDDLESWLSAREAQDDRAAIAAGLRLVQRGACPLEVRLCLPGCWQRARGLDDLEDLVDSLAASPGLSGGERALLMVAAARLHPAALATSEATPAPLLIAAAALGAAASGAAAEAAALWPLCAPDSRAPGTLERVARAELRLLGGPAWPACAAPAGPPSPALAERIAASLLGRAGQLRRAGQPLLALGLVALGLPLAQVSRLPLLALGAELRALLGDLDAADALLDEIDRHESRITVLARSTLTRASVALERDQPQQAEGLVASLLASLPAGSAGAARALVLRGASLLALERADAEAPLHQALAEAPAGASGDAARAAALHWLGVAAAARDDHEAAEEALRRSLALAADPFDAQATRIALGASLAALGRQGEAAACFERAHRALERGLGASHPRSQLAAGCVDDLEAWREALDLERLLAGFSGDEAEAAQLRGFRRYLLLRGSASKRLLTTALGGLAAGAVAFVAPDMAEAFVEQAPENLRNALEGFCAEGPALAALLRRGGADGVVFHLNGKTITLPLSFWGDP